MRCVRRIRHLHGDNPPHPVERTPFGIGKVRFEVAFVLPQHADCPYGIDAYHDDGEAPANATHI